jgi:hypothetical protein
VPEQQQQTDVEKLVGELEIGVDRVRSLYEQYFMGIEKLEPLVPRKDVDRRIQMLRKEQIRNTALRFRFQMIVQRYNTYQTHWQRICREIENGTYKRHVARATKRFAPEQERRSTAPPPRRSSVPPRSEGAAGTEASLSPRPPSVAPPPKPAPMRAPPPAAPAGFPQPGAAVSAALAAELADLEADFGPLGGGAPIRPIAPASALGPDRKGPVPPAVATPAGSPARPAGVAKPGVPPPFAAKPPVPTAPGGQPPPARPIDAARPQGPPAPAQRPQPAPPPARPVAPAAQPAAPQPAPAPRAPAAAPAPRAPVAAPVPADAAAARPPAASAADLSDQRVRALYQQYVDAKRRQNESTAAITYEGVAKSLRDSSAKLREKHGKSVDFEVTVRDGKTILKPVLK